MKKDFDGWSEFKKNLEDKERVVFAWPREIWWCSLGINLGAEIDGKNDLFERAVLVMRVYNRETMLILPITTKRKNDQFHYGIFIKTASSPTKDYLELDKLVWVKLTQSRVISNKRLLRKICVISDEDYHKIREAFKKDGI